MAPLIPAEIVGGFPCSRLGRDTTTITTCIKAIIAMASGGIILIRRKWLIWTLSKLGLAYDLRRQSSQPQLATSPNSPLASGSVTLRNRPLVVSLFQSL